MMKTIVSAEHFNYVSIVLFPKLGGSYLIFIFCVSGLFYNKNVINNRQPSLPFMSLQCCFNAMVVCAAIECDRNMRDASHSSG